MNTFRKTLVLMLGLLLPLPQLFAQTSPGETMVSATAQALGLPLVSPPAWGTFWTISPGASGIFPVPMPCMPLDAGAPVFAISDGQYLVDETGAASDASTAVLTDQSNAVVNLVAEVQTTAANPQLQAMSRLGVSRFSPDDDGDGGGDASEYAGFTPNTNELWLAITNVANGLAYLTLNNATDYVYEIWSKTDLAQTNWNIETEVWPSNSVTMPFSVGEDGRTNLFIWARDWTGVTENGNTTPSWWLWEYFGTTDLSDTNRDGQGNTLLTDYEYGDDPNVIFFTLATTNNYFNTVSAPVRLNVEAGWPDYVAVSVDDTNYATDAAWESFTATNLNVTLGLTEGWHQVWVGLKGRAPNATVTWQWTRLKLILTPPQLVITGLTNGPITVPVIQLTGYSSDALASLSFDLSNAVETVTHQLVAITGQAYDTNSAEFSTNYFQACDVPLTNGWNVITLSATDLAGNVGTLTTNIWCAATNLPVINLLWPQDGMQISGGSFTIHGQVNDPTTTVSVTGVDANGNAIQLSGLTGRDGNFWVENVPLTAAEDTLTLAVSNNMGGTALNFSVSESAVALTIDNVQAGDGSAYGTIGVTNGYTIWVDDVEAAQDGAGNWSTPITPVGFGGGMVTVTAVPNTDGDAEGALGWIDSRDSWFHSDTTSPSINTEATVQPLPPSMFPSSYHFNVKQSSPEANSYSTVDWANGQGGSEINYWIQAEGPWQLAEYIWPATSWPQGYPGGTYVFAEWYEETGLYTYTGPSDYFPTLPQNHCDTYHVYGTYSERHTEDAGQTLATGGPLGSKAQNLWEIIGGGVDQVTYRDIPLDQFSLGGFGREGADNCVYALLADNTEVSVTPQTANNDYSFSPGVQAVHVPLGPITVVSNSAVQIGGTTNWAAVMTTSNDWVYVQAPYFAGDPLAAHYIQWSGGESVPGDPSMVRVSKGTSAETTVTATLGSTSVSLNVWIVWANLTCKVSGTIDPDDKAIVLTNGNWPTRPLTTYQYDLGGGANLGPVDCLSNTKLNYAYTIGKMEAKAILQPHGVGNLVTNGAWNILRSKIVKSWDNGQSDSPASGDDTSSAGFQYLNPANGDIFDLDTPGCSAVLPGTQIINTAEVYEDFYEYVAVNLGNGDQICSATNTYSYVAQVDGEAATVRTNGLSSSIITLPTTPYYPVR